MKKILMTLAAVLCCAMTTTTLTSCSIEDNPVSNPVAEPDNRAEATIMYYGNGGGNVDLALLASLCSCHKADPKSFEKVNFVSQFKFSTPNNMIMNNWVENLAKYLGSNTIRWAVNPNEPNAYYRLNTVSEFYGDYNADITNPDSLTNFINWAAKTYPAKKYILVMADHGGGYMPSDDLPESTASAVQHRGLLYDDGRDNRHFTVKSLARCIRQANVHIETLFMQACMMNNMEYQFELKDIVDYIAASTYTMQSNVSFNALIDEFAKPQTTEEALAAFCKTTVEGWENSDDDKSYRDLTVTRTANLNKLGEMMRVFTDRLCDTYANGTDVQRQKIDSCTARAIKVEEGRPYYDIAKYISSLMGSLPEVYDEPFVTQFADAFNSGLVAQNYSRYLTEHNYQVDYSVMLGAKGFYFYTLWKTDAETGQKVPTYSLVYYPDGKREWYELVPAENNPGSYLFKFNSESTPWGSTLADTYEQLEFDRIVGWSRWIKLNGQMPSLFCPHDLNLNLPDGDVSDNPQLSPRY